MSGSIHHVGVPVKMQPVCFSGISRPQDFCISLPFEVAGASTHWHLPDHQAVAFGRLLPILACGEESAIHVFSSLASLEAAPPNEEFTRRAWSKQVLEKIALDEMRHEALLAALRARVPDTLDTQTRRQARRFFAGLNHTDPAIHFIRIAALDSAVCQILAPLLARNSPLTAVQEISTTLNQIRADEGRHVRISKDYAHVWGATPEQIHDEWHAVRSQLVIMLGCVCDDLAMLGADPVTLFNKLIRSPDLLTPEKK